MLHDDCLDLCRICLVHESCMTFVWHPCQIVVSIRVASVSNCLLCWAQVAANDSNIDINMVELLQVASDKLLVQFNVAMVGNSYRPGVIRRNHRYMRTLHAVCKTRAAEVKWCCYASSPARAARQIQAKIPRFTCTAKVALHPSAQVASKRLRKELEQRKCKGHEIDDICLEETTLDSGEDDSEG